MGIGDIFKASKNRELENRVRELESLLSPEHREILWMQEQIEQLKKEQLSEQEQVNRKRSEIDNLNQNICTLNSRIDAAKQELIDVEEEVLMQSFGLYTPQYAFAHSDIYKDKLAVIREEQKLMIKKRNRRYR